MRSPWSNRSLYIISRTNPVSSNPTSSHLISQTFKSMSTPLQKPSMRTTKLPTKLNLRPSHKARFCTTFPIPKPIRTFHSAFYNLHSAFCQLVSVLPSLPPFLHQVVKPVLRIPCTLHTYHSASRGYIATLSFLVQTFKFPVSQPPSFAKWERCCSNV